MELKIEKMTIKDLEGIADTLTSEFDDFWNYNILKQELLSSTSHIFTAKIQQERANIKEIVGFAAVQFIVDEADITNIVVRKDCRNQGIGRFLLDKLVSVSKDNGMSCITLEVNEKNCYAVKLYNSFGFKVTGLRKNYYNGKDNAIIMTLKF